MSAASVQDTVAHVVLLWKEPKALQAAQYIQVLCMPFPVLALNVFVFAQTSGGGEGGKKGGGQ